MVHSLCFPTCSIVVEAKEQEEEIAIRRTAGQAEKLKGK